MSPLWHAAVMADEHVDDGPAQTATGSWWVSALGAVVALAGAAVALWALVYLRAALAPENSTNPA